MITPWTTDTIKVTHNPITQYISSGKNSLEFVFVRRQNTLPPVRITCDISLPQYRTVPTSTSLFP